MGLNDRRGNIGGGLWDITWKKWQQGQIPATWGRRPRADREYCR